ncbi:hypothetical protein GLAREA_05314 [Glarea lozoyensis ATCC 20868]|uniref:Heterokaryon incompatibility domain-containing protein n=1 Tax=Glarea lozoyensis (strain ATCC 20868 / MF5171) TaxID=1116229 RepID=S3DVK3_GLAL2|nr:uncharacterized protein GLAREA_05314 [Glarea lozoyensis ATCC 20868]EPE35976.1 hypothetical protein GLAREA_05314 [Glarea lozoyensis ATCC 20868]
MDSTGVDTTRKGAVPTKVNFSEKQVYWQCQCATWLEETVLENSIAVEFMHRPGNGRKDEMAIAQKDHGYFRTYEALVDDYYQRQLTFKSDALNAFSGITSALSLMQTIHVSRLSPGNKLLGHWSQLYDWRLNGLRNEWKGSPSKINDSINHVLTANTSPFVDSGHLQFWSSRAAFWIYRTTRGEQYYDREQYSGLPKSRKEFHPDEPIRLHLDSGDDLQWTKRPGAIKSCGRKLPEPKPRFGGVRTAFTDFYEHVPLMQRVIYPMASVIVGDANYGVEIDSKRHPEIPTKKRQANPLAETTITYDGHAHITGDLSKLLGTELPEEYGPFCPTEDLFVDPREGDSEATEVDLVVIGRSIAEPSRYLKVLVVRWENRTAYRLGCGLVGEKDWARLDNREWNLIRLG